MSTRHGAAGGQPPRKLRAEERAAGLLQSCGLVSGREVMDGGLRLVAAQRERAATVTVHLGGVARYMVKLGRRQARESMDREILSYQAVSTGSERPVAPRLAHADISRGALVTEFLDPAVTLHDFYLDAPMHSADVVDGLSDVVAQMALLPDAQVQDLPPVLPWILTRQWDGRDAQIAGLFADPDDLAAVLERLEDARCLWHSPALIHGDLKFDNCMMIARDAGQPAQIRLIDWELAGLGDPAWDLATLMQEYLLISDGEAGHAAGRALAPTGETARDARRLIARYGSTCGLTNAQSADLTDRVARYIGCRLVQTAYELETVEGVDGPRTQGAIALAAQLCQAPHAFWAGSGDHTP